MNEKLRLRSLSRVQVEAFQVLYSTQLAIQTAWIGRQWSWKFQRATVEYSFPVRIVANWGGAVVILCTSLNWYEQVTKLLVGNVAIGTLPADIQVALAEAAFTELADRLEAASKKPLQIEAVRIDDIDNLQHYCQEQLTRLHMQSICDGLEFDGELWLDPQALSHAAVVAKSIESRHSSRYIRWPMLAFPVCLVIGQTLLAPTAFVSLTLNDVILLDECWLQKSDMLTVELGGGIAFCGRLEGQRLIITELLKRTMLKPSSDTTTYISELNTTQGINNAHINDLPVRLTFDLGERTLTLSELESLEHGYVFDLGCDLRESVVIRANGMRIGEGELVEISGRTGVVVLSLLGKKIDS